MLAIQSKRVSKENIWRDIMARRKNSGMTLAAFCKAEGIKCHTFKYWQNKFSRSALPVQARGVGHFVTMTLRGRASLANRTDMPSQKARIILPNGVQIDLGGGLEVLAVQQFLQNLCGVTSAKS